LLKNCRLFLLNWFKLRFYKSTRLDEEDISMIINRISLSLRTSYR